MAQRFDRPDLLAQLTLEEEAALVSGKGFWWTRPVERLAIPSVMVADGPHGLRKQAEAGDHLGIADSVPATCFPPAAALGSTWDVELVRRVGEAIGSEARAQGVAVVLGPGINIKRTPLCGRNFEYLSEDPLLSGTLGAAMVEGIQSHGVGTSLKHYAANNQETDRLRVSADIDERPLREIYLAGFERVVRTAGPWTVMCSYNRINGVYASQDRWLLTEVLRDEWGFDGLVVSDWGAVEDPVAAVAAGLDLEMPSTGGASAARIAAAVEAGELDEAVLDTSVDRVLQLLERARPGVEADHECDPDAHHHLARTAAAQAAVLLKNESEALPLVPSPGTRVAVIGEFARTPRYQGAGSSRVNPTRVDDALSALRQAVPQGVAVDFAAGFGVDDPSADHEALRAEAVEVARGVATAVVFLGLPPSFESESYDRDHLDLPAEQLELLAAVADVAEEVVVVLANGSVVTVSGWADHAEAILEGWLGGQASGSAIVDVLLGAVNPSGRLAETIPRRLADTPAYLQFPGEDRHVRYGEGLFVGYRHHDAVDGPVAYPFGHGLSYTTFSYTDLDVSPIPAASASAGAGGEPGPGSTGPIASSPNGSVGVPATSGGVSSGPDWLGPVRVRVAVTVTNAGAVAGSEVVQCYVGAPDASATRAVRELKAFAKVHLDPGQAQRVELVLTERDLSTWAVRAGGWVLEPGRFEVAVGASSRDLRLRATVHVDGAPPVLPLDRASTLDEWLAHPTGRPLVLAGLAANPAGDLTPLLDDPAQRRMIGPFPLNRLAAMIGGGGDYDLVSDLLSQLEAGPAVDTRPIPD